MSTNFKKVVSFLSFLLVATASWALTEAELQDRAATLHADFEALEAQVNDCPDGDCAEAQQLLDEQDMLGLELDVLHADRSALDGCACSELDATIAEVDALADHLRGSTEGWEEQL